MKTVIGWKIERFDPNDGSPSEYTVWIIDPIKTSEWNCGPSFSELSEAMSFLANDISQSIPARRSLEASLSRG